MAAKLTPIINAIHTLITGLNTPSAMFVDVKKYPTNTFAGYPSITIVPAEVIAEYATEVQNSRTYSLYIYIYLSLEDTSDETAWAQMCDLVDLVFDTLDSSMDLGATCDFVRPLGMQPYEEVVTGGGKCLVAPIKIDCVKTIEL